MNKLFTICSLFAVSAIAADTNFIPFLTINGQTYSNVEIGTVTASRATLFFDGGGKQFAISNLPSFLQKRFDYDPVKARAVEIANEQSKAAMLERNRQEVLAVTAAENTLSEPKTVRVLKILSGIRLQIECDGVHSEAYIPNLPGEVLNSIREFEAAQADADSLAEQARRARLDANNLTSIAINTPTDNPDFSERNAQAGVKRNYATDLEARSVVAERNLKKIKEETPRRTTIVARATGKVNGVLRRWEFEKMETRGYGDMTQNPTP